jgi:hypothetical protein
VFNEEGLGGFEGRRSRGHRSAIDGRFAIRPDGRSYSRVSGFEVIERRCKSTIGGVGRRLERERHRAPTQRQCP